MTEYKNEQDTPLSAIAVGKKGWIMGKVLAICYEGKGVDIEPVVLLMKDSEELVFEAWLGFSTNATRKAMSVKQGDEIVLECYRSDPVRSHRTYGGLRTALDTIDFATVQDLRIES